MPRNFPDMDSLKWNAECRNFRQPNEGESEPEYREALAAHVGGLGDHIEAMEIRSGKGWDQWGSNETVAVLEAASPGISSIFAEARKRSTDEALEKLETADAKETREILDSVCAGLKGQNHFAGGRTGLSSADLAEAMRDQEASIRKSQGSEEPKNAHYVFLFDDCVWINELPKNFDIPDDALEKYSFSLTEAVNYNKTVGQVFCMNRKLSAFDDKHQNIVAGSPHPAYVSWVLREQCPRRLFEVARVVVAHFKGERYILKHYGPFGTIHINKIADHALTREAYAFSLGF